MTQILGVETCQRSQWVEIGPSNGRFGRGGAPCSGAFVAMGGNRPVEWKISYESVRRKFRVCRNGWKSARRMEVPTDSAGTVLTFESQWVEIDSTNGRN